MNNFWSSIHKTLLTISGILFFIAASHAQTIEDTGSRTATIYSVKPDYRKCASPMCGGWFLTPLNQFSIQLETEDEAYQNSLLLPNTIYVAYINFKRLDLTDKQTLELHSAMYSQQALLRGVIVTTPTATDKIFNPKTLMTNGAWIGANKNTPVGPYLKISSSGIMCITTPCPYYKADLLNSHYSFNFDELTLTKAELDREQEAQAWQAVASTGLVLTGIKYASQGQIGTGLGISASKVFFAFPPSNRVEQ